MVVGEQPTYLRGQLSQVQVSGQLLQGGEGDGVKGELGFLFAVAYQSTNKMSKQTKLAIEV